MYSSRPGALLFESRLNSMMDVDGEFGGAHDEVTVENLNRQLFGLWFLKNISRELMSNPELLEDAKDESVKNDRVRKG